MTLHSHPESAQPAPATGVPLPTDLSVSSGKALAAIERFIHDAPDNSRVYEINPSMAQYLLDKYNIANRPTKPAKIALYAATMLKQEWRLTGDTIKFSDRGILRDGQNRLLACVKSSTPFTTHVVFGIDDSFFNVMDQGKNRDGSDLLAIAGVANSTIVAGAVRWAHLYETGTIMQRTTLAPPEVLRLYEERYPSIVDFVPYARATYSHTKWPAGFIAGSLYHLAKIDGKAGHDFGHAMANNNWTGRYLPLSKMNSQLAGIAGVSSGRINDVVRAALLIICWNLVRENKKGKQKDFMWNDKLPFPEAK